MTNVPKTWKLAKVVAVLKPKKLAMLQAATDPSACSVFCINLTNV